jgi:hypothetical protein
MLTDFTNKQAGKAARLTDVAGALGAAIAKRLDAWVLTWANLLPAGFTPVSLRPGWTCFMPPASGAGASPLLNPAAVPQPKQRTADYRFTSRSDQGRREARFRHRFGIVRRFEQAESPELELLLSGCANRQQREAVLDAFHAFADGDHKGFAVKFAVLLQAHAAALHATPERILGVVQPVLSEHGRNFTDSAACATRACGEVKEQVSALLDAGAKLSELVTQGRAAKFTARDQFLGVVQTETKKVKDAAAEILSISEKRIALGLLMSYLVGILTWPALDGFVRLVSRVF